MTSSSVVGELRTKLAFEQRDEGILKRNACPGSQQPLIGQPRKRFLNLHRVDRGSRQCHQCRRTDYGSAHVFGGDEGAAQVGQPRFHPAVLGRAPTTKGHAHDIPEVEAVLIGELDQRCRVAIVPKRPAKEVRSPVFPKACARVNGWDDPRASSSASRPG